MLIHYIGDGSVANKENIPPYVRTCPSVLRELEKTERSPSVAYKKKIGTSISSAKHQSVLLPRNQKQVENLKARYRKDSECPIQFT